jgi:hypothetical protein
MSDARSSELEHLLRLPWTILKEVTPEGDTLLRVAEIPSAVGSGATPQEMERDLWESLQESLRAYLHFGDPIPSPRGPQPDWVRSPHGAVKAAYVLRVTDVATTATAAALIPPSDDSAT